uniref:Uncharacterized protein n=1 Tax=Candidatus Kentrum sp. FM TaxID=2126340 RepID=A0A450S5D7_9GAMM|nr:MAG: hypothetical protein BECKFM1743C_GA0114222_100418 [Candidatus Kentron sp. FM]VFJ48919.1 MAG: hypothetical protein BECKFM1743A_GA0114220_1006410 [Candidatus Kentron sp. FM]VFK08231.1 MAG: hypothetical protein BECKFM1743B_GA0114221_100639 [Candidatus Kentron sp. FM]
MSILSEFLTKLGVQDDFCIQLTRKTRQGQIILAGCAAVFFRKDMVNLVGRKTERIRDVAIFTAAIGPLKNLAAHGGGNIAPCATFSHNQLTFKKIIRMEKVAHEVI